MSRCFNVSVGSLLHASRPFQYRNQTSREPPYFSRKLTSVIRLPSWLFVRLDAYYLSEFWGSPANRGPCNSRLLRHTSPFYFFLLGRPPLPHFQPSTSCISKHSLGRARPGHPTSQQNFLVPHPVFFFSRSALRCVCVTAHLFRTIFTETTARNTTADEGSTLVTLFSMSCCSHTNVAFHLLPGLRSVSENKELSPTKGSG